MGETRNLAAILVADVVGYSLLAEADKDRRESYSDAIIRMANKGKSDRP